MDADDLTNRWTITGDPARLTEAAAALRGVPAELIFEARYPGEYVKAAVARLLDAIARDMRGKGHLGHDVVSAAAELSEHAIAYVAKARDADRGEAAPALGRSVRPEPPARPVEHHREPVLEPGADVPEHRLSR